MVTKFLRENQAVLLLCAATALLTTGQGIAVPIIPLYADTLGASAAQVGLVVSAFALARFLTNVPAAALSDRYGRRLLLVGGPFVAAAGNLLAATADSMAPLLLWRFVAGIGSAAFITGAVIFISDVSTADNRGKLLSIYQGSFLLGMTLGPAIGGLTAELFGLRAPFIVVGIFSVASGIWAFFRVPETRVSETRGAPRAVAPSGGGLAAEPHSQNRREAGSRFFFSRDFLLISLVFLATFFTRGGAQFTVVPLKARHDLGLSPGQIGLLFTIPSVLGFVTLPFVGAFSDRYGRKKAIVPGLLFFSLALVVLGMSPSLGLFAVGMLLYGLAQGIEGPTPVAYVADIAPRERLAMAQGVVRSLGDFSLLVAAPLMGFILDQAGATVTLVANGVFVAILCLVFLAFASDPVVTRRRNSQAQGR